MNRILDALRSPGAMMVALVLALIAQGEHTAQVFAFFSHSASNAQFLAYAFAAAVEVAVLLFVLKGHKGISFAFAAATLCTNVVYYAIGGVDLLSVALLPVLLLSALLPGVIVGYSHTIAETGRTAATPATQTATTRLVEGEREWRAYWAATQPAQARRFRWQFWRKPAETPAETPMPIDTTNAPIAQPAPSGGHSEGVSESPTEQEPAQSKPQPETKVIALRMIGDGAKPADVAQELQVSLNTVRSWVARSKQTNGKVHA